MDFPDLLEFNCGVPDWRCPVSSPSALAFNQVSKLIGCWPAEIPRVGIGGSPLRSDWWGELVDQLSAKPQSITLVSHASDLTPDKIDRVERYRNLCLYIQVKEASELDSLAQLNLLSTPILVDASDAEQDSQLLPRLKTMGLKYRLEQSIWHNLSASAPSGYSPRTCLLFAKQIIGLDAKGDIYPCIALATTRHKLGNILSESWPELLVHYHTWHDQLTCSSCCQARSWHHGGKLNYDPWCPANHKNE